MTPHHAVVYYAPDISVLPEEISVQSADIHHVFRERLGIDTVRIIQQYAWQKPVAETFVTVVISLEQATTEAQNALLKMLEEPPVTTRFVVRTSSPEVLLDTVRSRLMVVKNITSNNKTDANFVSLSISERMKEIEVQTKAKNLDWINATYDELSLLIQTSGEMHAKAALLDVTQYRKLTGASQKMLLEHLALLI